MMPALARMLPDGKRLHLHHGPIDLVIGADGEPQQVRRAYEAAIARFETVLEELTAELETLRREVPPQGLILSGEIACAMERAVRPHWPLQVTPMAAVAGAVADHMLGCMTAAADLSRAYVNNGGDIALHLTGDTAFTTASPAGMIVIRRADDVHGIATSGWRGRSFSLGIADSVTVLARTAAEADAAATLIANAVDLPGSPKVTRQPARELAPDSDLRDRLVTVGVDVLNDNEVQQALAAGQRCAGRLLQAGRIHSAILLLQNSHHVLPPPCGEGSRVGVALDYETVANHLQNHQTPTPTLPTRGREKSASHA